MFVLLLCRLQEGGVTQVLAIINGALACTCRMVAPRASARYTICTFNVVNTYAISVRVANSAPFLENNGQLILLFGAILFFFFFLNFFFFLLVKSLLA
jgi:hypothetical protein